ncbi:MAG: hypothetical protein ACXVBW_09645, partial [Bdellovibrionota bacterium]
RLDKRTSEGTFLSNEWTGGCYPLFQAWQGRARLLYPEGQYLSLGLEDETITPAGGEPESVHDEGLHREIHIGFDGRGTMILQDGRAIPLKCKGGG